MKKNIGNSDKLIRIVLGLLIIIVAGYFQSWWALLGVVLVGTAFMRFCGLYTLFSVNTCKYDVKTEQVKSAETTSKAPDVADRM
jgi:hypothetical protein